MKHHLVSASLMDCSQLARPLAYSMQSPRMFLRQIFMHSFSVGVSSLCLKVSMQVSKHLAFRNRVTSLYIIIQLSHNQMSLVQIAYNSLLTRLRDWNRLEGKERLELLQQASSLFGESFRAALNLLENSPQKLQICEYDHFYVMVSSLQKCLLFKSSSKVRLCDCTCKSSWLRKAGEKAAYMCFHQIVLELVLCIFAGRISISKVDCPGTAQLAEYLQAIQ